MALLQYMGQSFGGGFMEHDMGHDEIKALIRVTRFIRILMLEMGSEPY